MLEALSLLIVLAGAVAVVLYAWRNLRIRDRALQRMESLGPNVAAGPRVDRSPLPAAASAHALAGRHAAGVLVYFAFGWSTPFAVAVG